MSLLASEFVMKDLGPLSYFLGIAVSCHPYDIIPSQGNYASEIINMLAWRVANSQPLLLTPSINSTLLPALFLGIHLSIIVLQGLYSISPLIDLTYHMLFNKFFFTCIHLAQSTWLLSSALCAMFRARYIFGLHLSPSPISKLISYTRVNWGGCPNTRRSTSGYYGFLGDNLIFWSSKRQYTLSRSKVEAKYRGIVNVVYESCWSPNLLMEVHFPLPHVTLLYCDNVSVIYLSSNLVHNQYTKHIEMDIHFVRKNVVVDRRAFFMFPLYTKLQTFSLKGFLTFSLMIFESV